jgi:hypothetical protein
MALGTPQVLPRIIVPVLITNNSPTVKEFHSIDTARDYPMIIRRDAIATRSPWRRHPVSIRFNLNSRVFATCLLMNSIVFYLFVKNQRDYSQETALIAEVETSYTFSLGVFILGMHRSGTSMLSGLLVKGFGYEIGGDELPAQEDVSDDVASLICVHLHLV